MGWKYEIAINTKQDSGEWRYEIVHATGSIWSCLRVLWGERKNPVAVRLVIRSVLR